MVEWWEYLIFSLMQSIGWAVGIIVGCHIYFKWKSKTPVNSKRKQGKRHLTLKQVERNIGKECIYCPDNKYFVKVRIISLDKGIIWVKDEAIGKLIKTSEKWLFKE